MKNIVFGLLFCLILFALASCAAPPAGPANDTNSLFLKILPFLILLVIVAFIQFKIGKAIGTRLSKESGLILGIVLIIVGVTLFIGIPIIIYSNKKIGLKKCPFCANDIKSEAIICQFCKKELTENN